MKGASKKMNRGPYSKEEGDQKGGKKKALVSYIEGTKANKKLPDKSRTPKPKFGKK